MDQLRLWWKIARPKTLPAALAPTICGSALAWSQGKFSVIVLCLALLTSLCLQIGANFANDYFDFRKGTDRKEDRQGPERVLTTGLVTESQMLWATVGILVLAVLCGSYLIYLGGFYFIWLALACLLGAVLYTAGPFALAYNGWADLAVFIFFGLIAVDGTFYLHTSSLTKEAIAASCGIGALVVNILVVNNVRDRNTDQISHRKTLPVRFGKNFGLWEYKIMLFIAYAAVIFLAFTWRPVLLALLTLPLGIKLYRDLKNLEGPVLNKTLGLTGKLVLLYALLVSLGSILG